MYNLNNYVYDPLLPYLCKLEELHEELTLDKTWMSAYFQTRAI